MEGVKALIDRAVSNRKASGHFFKGNKMDACPKCYENVDAVPAVCWSEPVGDEWKMSGLHTHVCSKDVPAALDVYRPTKDPDFVVFVTGRPCPISAAEKEAYLEDVARGVKIIEIRDYVFDKLYPIIPFSEWKMDEDRRSNRN